MISLFQEMMIKITLPAVKGRPGPSAAGVLFSVSVGRIFLHLRSVLNRKEKTAIMLPVAQKAADTTTND